MCSLNVSPESLLFYAIFLFVSAFALLRYILQYMYTLTDLQDKNAFTRLTLIMFSI